MCGSCDEWKSREISRFRSGEYSRPVWDNKDEDWDSFVDVRVAFTEQSKHHYAHVSLNNQAMLAYTENDTKGKADRQTPIKVGRYLNRFTEGLSEDRIREVVEAHNACFDFGELEIADTSSKIVAVYRNGPNSCMSHDIDSFTSHIHPTSVYGSGDLGVAYIGGIAKPRARVLVHLEKKIYSTIYGDSARLKAVLTKSGYEPDKDCVGFEGAKIMKIPSPTYDDLHVLPYIDNDYGVSMSNCRKHFVMSQNPDYSCAQHTHGLCNEAGWWCNYCESHQETDEDDSYYVDDLGSICQCCYEDNYFYCEHCDTTHHNDDYQEVYCFRTTREGKRVEDSYSCCYDCANENHYYCEDCNKYFDEGNTSETDEMVRCEACHVTHEKEVELELQTEEENKLNEE